VEDSRNFPHLTQDYFAPHAASYMHPVGCQFHRQGHQPRQDSANMQQQQRAYNAQQLQLELQAGQQVQHQVYLPLHHPYYTSFDDSLSPAHLPITHEPYTNTSHPHTHYHHHATHAHARNTPHLPHSTPSYPHQPLETPSICSQREERQSNHTNHNSHCLPPEDGPLASSEIDQLELSDSVDGLLLPELPPDDMALDFTGHELRDSFDLF